MTNIFGDYTLFSAQRKLSLSDLLQMTPEQYSEYRSKLNLNSSIFENASFDAEAYLNESANQLTASEEDTSDIDDLFEELSKNENTKQLMDLNQDGVITDEEMALFKKYLKGLSKNLTKEQLQKLFDDIKNGKLKYSPDVADADTSIDNPFSADGEETSNNIFNNNTDSGNSGSGVEQNTTHDITNMSLSQLGDEKTLRQENYDNAKEALEDVYSGKDKAVATAQEEYEKQKENYQKVIKNDSEEAQQIEQQRAEKQAQIEQAEAERDSIQTNITDTESQISDVSNSIDACDENIDALEDALDSYDDVSEDDEEGKAEAEEAKQQIAEQISENEEKKTELEDEKNTLETSLSDLNEKLEEQENLIKELNAEYQEIENSLTQVCSPETLEALQAMDDAKANVNTVKSERAEQVRETLNQAKEDLEEVNKSYNEKQAKSDARKLSSPSAEKAVELAEELQGISLSELKKMFRENGYTFNDGLYCADFVSMVLDMGVGYENLPEWYQNLENKSSCPRIRGAADGNEISLDEAQKGDMVLFDWDGDGKSDHVGLYVSDGSNGSTFISIEGNTEYGPVSEIERDRSTVCAVYSMKKKK